MKTPCLECLGWEEDHPKGHCPGRPDGLEDYLGRQIEQRYPVAARVAASAVKWFPWLRGS